MQAAGKLISEHWVGKTYIEIVEQAAMNLPSTLGRQDKVANSQNNVKDNLQTFYLQPYFLLMDILHAKP